MFIERLNPHGAPERLHFSNVFSIITTTTTIYYIAPISLATFQHADDDVLKMQ